MRRLAGLFVAIGRHGVLSFVGSAAPIAAFVATKGGGRTGPAPERSEAAEAQRRMAGAGYFASRCKASCEDATENSRLAPLRGRAACRRVALSEGRGAVLSDRPGNACEPARAECARHGVRVPYRRQRQNSMKRATSSGASCTRSGSPKRIDAETSEILVEVSAARRQDDRLDPVRCRPCRLKLVHRTDLRPDRRRERCRGDAVWPEREWLRDERLKVPRPSACQADRNGATIWSRCPRRPPSRRLPAPKRTALPRRWPIARRGVSIGALPLAERSNPCGSS